ncbi:MAG: hypothetical protein COT18_06140 [Elusimicrobia bacterium CG08_land_8_20_14_0_20_59_10]|nr:MAG: hypothetical protein COT18_06140 [Elusimicrobia bacterium CG08_land_8_20_14_0_20_59_10]
MKKTTFVCAAAFLVLSPAAFAGEFKDKDGIIAVDLPSGWAQGSSDDPLVTLKLEKGRSFCEFAKQDSELGDYYLKARVKEHIESLRSKGASPSDVKPLSLHGVSTAYYIAYALAGTPAGVAFLTYNGASYSVTGNGMSDGEFRGMLTTVRKPGEKIVLPKKPRVVRVKKVRDEEEEEQRVDDARLEAAISSAAIAAAIPETPAQPEETPEAPSATQQAAHAFLDELSRTNADSSAPPYFARKPLPPALWGALIAFWIFGSFIARGIASTYQNPKLSPPSGDIPPDFFFPFMVSRFSTFSDVSYNVTTRQKQLLAAHYPYEHQPYVAGSVYACLLFHIGWSALELAGRGPVVMNLLLRLPGGRIFASVPEIFFIVPLLIGVIFWCIKKPVMELYDAQRNLVMRALPELAYCLIRDGGGKEVARLVQKGGRRWDFVDTDNLVVFSIQDDFPRARLLRKLFGCQGGALRTHYGIFVQDRRAGFVFLDPMSADRFQIHMDFDFARLAHPAQILISLLYLISREKDPVYPSPF